MHDATMTSGPAAAAAVLSFERSVPAPPPGNAATTDLVG
jgi:hypothetical protein